MADEYDELGTEVGVGGVARPVTAGRQQEDWDSITDSAAYKVLSTGRKQARKEQYFSEVMAPKAGNDPQKLAAAHQQFMDYEPGRKVGFGESVLRSFGLEANKVAAAEPIVAAAAPVLIGKGLGLAHESIEWLRQHHLPGAEQLASASQALKQGQDWATDQADQLFGASDALRQRGQDYYGPKAGERFNHAGQLIGSLPVQMATLPLQSAERGQELINQGVPADAAQRAVIGDTAFNVLTAPLRGLGANMLARAATGALVGGGTGVAQRLLEKAELGDDAPEDVREAPLLSGDDAVGAAIGGVLGAHGGGKAGEPAPRVGRPERSLGLSPPAAAPDAAAQRRPAPEAAVDSPAPPGTTPPALPGAPPFVSATRPSAERVVDSAVAGSAKDAGRHGPSHPFPSLAADEHAHGEAAAEVAPGTLHPDDLAATTHLFQTDPASAMRLHAQHADNVAAFKAAVEERLHANEQLRQAAGQAGGSDARGAGDRGAPPPHGGAGEPREPGAPAPDLGRGAEPAQVASGAPPPRAKGQRPWIVTDHDVPLAGGRDAPGPQPRRTYIDHGIPEWVHVPEAGKWVNAWEEIDQHERAEEPQLDQYGYGHPGDAHDRFGNRATAEYLKQQGVKPPDYARALKPYVDAARERAESGAADRLPPDLDRRPYEGSGDVHLLDNSRAAGEPGREPALAAVGHAGEGAGPPDPPPVSGMPEAPRAPEPGARSFMGEELRPASAEELPPPPAPGKRTTEPAAPSRSDQGRNAKREPRAPGNGGSVASRGRRLLGTVPVTIVHKADGVGHQVVHPATGAVIAEGLNEREAWKSAEKVARRDGRGKLLARLGPAAMAAPPGTRAVHLYSRSDYSKACRKPRPDTIYHYQGLQFLTDGLGRSIVSAGRLVLGKGRQRFSSDSRKGYPHHPDAQPGDVGFHAGGDQFGFPGGVLNVFPGSGKLNAANGAYGTFEREVLRPLVADPRNHVTAEFHRIFKPGNETSRPDRILVKYRVNDGPQVEAFFANNETGK